MGRRPSTSPSSSATTPGPPVETRVNGRPTGEYGLNAMVLGAWGIPIGLVAGDDALAEEVADWLPWAERVIVKHADGTHSAASAHPAVARERIQAAAAEAVRRAASGSLSPLELEPPVTIEIDYATGVRADFGAVVPGATRVAGRTVRFVAVDPVDAYRGFLAINRLASAVG
jgi:D-amino peptidase